MIYTRDPQERRNCGYCAADCEPAVPLRLSGHNGDSLSPHSLFETLAIRRSERRVAGLLLGKAAGAFLNDPEYRTRFIALVEGIDAGRDPVFYQAPLVMLFHSDALMPTPEEDAVLSAYNAALVATSLGLGTCFVSMAQKAISASRAVRSAMGLPRGQRILAVLAVVYPVARRLRPVIRPSLPVGVVQ